MRDRIEGFLRDNFAADYIVVFKRPQGYAGPASRPLFVRGTSFKDAARQARRMTGPRYDYHRAGVWTFKMWHNMDEPVVEE